MTELDAEKKKGIRRMALMLAAVATVFFLGFILMGVLNS